MNDHDLDAVARRSAAAVRDEATRIASSRAALDRLVTSAPDAAQPVDDELDTPLALSTAPDRRMRWPWVAVAAATVTVFAGGLITNHDDDGTIGPADSPSTTVVEVPETGIVPVPTTPATNAPAPDTTAEPVTTPPIAPPTLAPMPTEQTVLVADVVRDEQLPEPEELYRFGIGEAPDELGLEPSDQCSECVTPWGPVVASDGRIVVADNINHRWVLVADGVPAVTEWPTDQRVVAQPVIDADDRLYVVTTTSNTSSGPGELQVLDLDELTTPLERHPVQALTYSQLWLTDHDVIVNGSAVDSVTVPTSAGARPTVEWKTEPGSPQQVVVTWDGVRRTWDFGATSGIGGGASPNGLPDGSALVVEVADQSLYRLLPSGEAIRSPRPGTIAVNGGQQLTADWILTLESDGSDLVVRRYALPGAVQDSTPTPTSPSSSTGDSIAGSPASLEDALAMAPSMTEVPRHVGSVIVA